MTEVTGALKILLWHVHGSWTTSFVQGPHHYLLPVVPGRGEWGRGRCGRDWPSTREMTPAELKEAEPDVVILQRPEEFALTEQWLGRTPGKDIPAVFVEHNAPRPHAATTRHFLGDQDAVPIAHVTPFNDLMWDNGRAPRRVIPHGIVDPGRRYTGELASGVAMINEPARRGRITGSDLLETFAAEGPIDVYGIAADEFRPKTPGPFPVRGLGDLDQHSLHSEVARRRVYLHTARWTSLGLSLLEAMHLGMPVVALGTTEAFTAVPPGAGAVSTDLSVLTSTFRDLLHEPDFATLAGKIAREHALAHYGLPAFTRNWNSVLKEVTR